ncbi:hypothetical protein [Endozoicomonas sp.]|uniref:hypothetical protein n=1 Tax=Endozoicomonas sp. TaxID=1892382 RepID=UPI003AF419AF
MKSNSTQMAMLLLLIWAGMILGISFLATPVKFTAPSLTLSAGVDVGRHVFAIFDNVQWLIIALLVLVSLRYSSSGMIRWLPLIVFMQIIQSAWLLPILNQQALDIIAGQKPQVGHFHAIYGVIELCKLLTVLALAWFLLSLEEGNS